MGDYFEIIADAEATEDAAPGLAASVVSWLTQKASSRPDRRTACSTQNPVTRLARATPQR
jgi:hypothetical protein